VVGGGTFGSRKKCPDRCDASGQVCLTFREENVSAYDHYAHAAAVSVTNITKLLCPDVSHKKAPKVVVT
jgi:hypothetical protein